MRSAISSHALPALALAFIAPLSGCYLTHVAEGQTRLLLARKPIPEVLMDPTEPAALRDRLARVPEVRDFATQLGLRVGKRYTAFAPWPGDRVVTTVVATRPGELEPAGFWFPIVGRVPYKGYFELERADAEAARLRAEGLDVCEVPVPAYSTLGWFDDPVTEPMLQDDEGDLVETLLHELTHATIYVPGDASWNEGVASFVGEEARIRFFAAHGGEEAAQRERERVEARRALRGLLLRAREEAKQVYAAFPPGRERDAARAAVNERTKAEVATLGYAPADAERIAARLRSNDACLALTATYASERPCLEQRLAAQGGDLRALIAQLVAAKEAGDPRGGVPGMAACEPPAD